MAADFRCLGPGGENLCVFGECDVNSSSSSHFYETCICNEGWMHDNAMYHSSGCTLPTAAPPIASAISIALAMCSTALLVWKYKFTSANQSLRLCLVIGVVHCWASALAVIGIWVQHGWYEITSAANLVIGVAMFAWEDQLVSVMLPKRLRELDNQLGENKVGVQFKVRIALCYITATMLAIGLVCLVTCRHQDALDFNRAIDAMLMVGVLILIVCSWGFWSVNKRLESQLEPMLYLGSNAYRIETRDFILRFIRKLFQLRNQAVVFVLFSVAFSAPWFIARRVLGSSPFSWVFCFLYLTSQQAFRLRSTWTLFSSSPLFATSSSQPGAAVAAATVAVQPESPGTVVVAALLPSKSTHLASQHQHHTAVGDDDGGGGGGSSVQLVDEFSPALLNTSADWKA